ncbi:MAG TPA: helix-turn-helix domain-containing protein [Candidatus Acidoferrales bacterium]|nr:helix-turn-helix domain-containing protein [Candidatus Acidoferrales bacterium]
MGTLLSTSSTSSRSRLKAPDRRAQILSAALDVFSEHGFHGTRTRELAARAGVSEALIFRHFPTKQALVREILRDAEARARMLERRFAEMPPREALQTLAEYVLTRLREDPRLFRVIFFGVLETPQLARAFYRRLLSRILALEERLFRRAFAESKRAGRCPAARVPPRIVARSFHGSLLFYNLAGAVVRMEPLPRDPRALAAAIVDLYLPGENP